MRTQRNFANSFNNRGQFRFGGGQGRRWMSTNSPTPGLSSPGYYRQGWRWMSPNNPADNPPESNLSNETTESSEWTYIGPCRCGRGPHAFYRSSRGNILHASKVKNIEL
ncbi:MAG: hypothetical protein ACP5UA_09650 [Candidatus Hydrogenedens sp.]